MSDSQVQVAEKILIIRMLSTADVCAVGLPVVRLFQQRLPQAEIHFLTFADGGKLMRMAEPNVNVHCLQSGEWPDDFFLAMESFLGLAEQIIGEEYTQIVNLDTAFMPCFLSRFLKDALEPISGNYISLSVQELLRQVQTKTLQADYVNNTASYLSSTFANIYKWQGSAWQHGHLPDGGYPEYYLSQCCGFDISDVSLNINVSPDKRLAKKARSGKVVGLCLSQSDDGYLYPYHAELKKALQQLGYHIWSDAEAAGDISTLLKMLAASDLMITKPSGNRWYAQAVSCPTLLISGDSEPALLMPEFATDTVPRCPKHAAIDNQLVDKLSCTCDLPNELAQSVESIFEHFAQEQDNG
jgi:ADP-heptose:LPS heptosyltransferase